MDVKHELFPETSDRIVYVRPVKAAELPDDIRAALGGVEHGERKQRILWSM